MSRKKRRVRPRDPKAPKGFDKNPGPDFPIVSVETGGKHFYSLQADFPEGVLLERYAKQKS